MPRKIPELKMYVLKTFNDSKEKLTVDALRVGRDKNLHAPIGSTVYALVCSGHLKSASVKGDVAKLYTITAEGKKYYQEIKDCEIKPYKPQQPQQPHKPQQPQQPEPLNLSLDAEMLTDSLSIVLHQNATYRQIMLKAINDIASALNFEVIDKSNKP